MFLSNPSNPIWLSVYAQKQHLVVSLPALECSFRGSNLLETCPPQAESRRHYNQISQESHRVCTFCLNLAPCKQNAILHRNIRVVKINNSLMPSRVSISTVPFDDGSLPITQSASRTGLCRNPAKKRQPRPDPMSSRTLDSQESRYSRRSSPRLSECLPAPRSTSRSLPHWSA